MKLYKYLATWIFMCSSFISTSQILTLKFSDSSGFIPFVYVFDSANKVVKVSNDSGKLFLASNNYKLCISHVSYERKVLNLTNITSDSVINILLKKRVESLDEVVISIGKPLKGVTYECGNLKQANTFTTGLFPNLKVGALVKGFDEKKQHRLRSINFKVVRKKAPVPEKFLMEIKFYEIVNKQISPNSINKIPVYLSSDAIKKINEITIPENVVFNGSELFVSFEIPEVENQNNLLIEFAGKLVNEDCQTFVVKNSGDWPVDVLNQACWTSETTGSHCMLNISVTYQDEL